MPVTNQDQTDTTIHLNEGMGPVNFVSVPLFSSDEEKEWSKKEWKQIQDRFLFWEHYLTAQCTLYGNQTRDRVLSVHVRSEMDAEILRAACIELNSPGIRTIKFEHTLKKYVKLSIHLCTAKEWMDTF